MGKRGVQQMGEMGVWVEKSNQIPRSNKKKETLRVHLSVRLERYAVCMLTCGERSESDEQMSRWTEKKSQTVTWLQHGSVASGENRGRVRETHKTRFGCDREEERECGIWGEWVE